MPEDAATLHAMQAADPTALAALFDAHADRPRSHPGHASSRRRRRLAAWCLPCRAIERPLEELKAGYVGRRRE